MHTNKAVDLSIKLQENKQAQRNNLANNQFKIISKGQKLNG